MANYMGQMVAAINEPWKLELDLTRASTSEDNIISTITIPMLEYFDKYWKSSCLVLAIVVVMDPRFKMKLVDFSFAKIFGDKAASYINIVDEGIRGLFQEYATDDVQGHLGNMCTLRPEMVQAALYSAKDWLCGEPIKSMESLVKMQFPI
ncbi:BED zinc finger, hAT family dimerization domain protein [Artemisia annua]|uniref:BED zinc finger, hAT family dimerization domain protein n=1 Tax=Artemisia annua TaxID=35608 RepID=A0A2U1NKC5_ARTAN|nr:BED zinc finger, hAT family dimerization domain protein [Artemisia annua]